MKHSSVKDFAQFLISYSFFLFKLYTNHSWVGQHTSWKEGSFSRWLMDILTVPNNNKFKKHNSILKSLLICLAIVYLFMKNNILKN